MKESSNEQRVMNLGQQIFAKDTWWLINMLDRDYVSTEIIITGIYTSEDYVVTANFNLKTKMVWPHNLEEPTTTTPT